MTIIPNWRRAWLMASMQVVGDALPLRIEGAVSWGKSSTDDLFALAAQV